MFSGMLNDFELRVHRYDLNKQDGINGTRKLLVEDHNRQQQPNVLNSLVVCCCLPNQLIVYPNRAQNRNMKSVLELPIILDDRPLRRHVKVR
jgi:hypothetical protein